MSSTNLEEAATVAAEYVSSLDNLPTEVQHLLSEIRHKETRSQELLQEIQKEGGKYVRHSLRTSNGVNGNGGGAASGSAGALSAKDSAIPHAVRTSYAELETLAVEKEQIAKRIVQLIARARTRLDHDLNRVLVLQGEVDPTLVATQTAAPYHHHLGARNPVAQINESLRNAIAIPEAPSTPSAMLGPPQKKRRVTASTSAGSIKLPSPAPVMASGGHVSASAVGQRSRLSQQVHPRPSPMRSRRVTASIGPEEGDEDAEGEEDLEENGEEGGDAEDKELYCFCQKLSYGEMIACDASDCKYQWFHLPCVNLKPPLPDRWYCSDCQHRLGVSVAGGTERQRKGRKK